MIYNVAEDSYSPGTRLEWRLIRDTAEIGRASETRAASGSKPGLGQEARDSRDLDRLAREPVRGPASG
ncbi:hypothetical protein EVAR_13236_1 [Eumeta japonica]|uniref:Uncharacterized protein n=1 Tax=Eumeta variegata TaxID=151549 RepID=A0A4C1TSQ4_EUMVA|nr:hypothetical protein EVAR_13236_1 [Eumeta japonica]